MGFPSPATDYVENRISLDEICATNAAHIYLMRSDGRSVREGIRKDALLVVDSAAEYRDGCILVLMKGGEFSLRRYCAGNGGRLESLDNPRDCQQVTEEMSLDRSEDDTVCFGVVTHVLNTLRPPGRKKGQ